jgi:FkbM family methyltransferase
MRINLLRALAPGRPHLREIIRWDSKLPFLAWRAGLLGQGAKTVKLVTGETLILRPPPATDTGTAMEVFVFENYKSPVPIQGVKHIVDLGANVGYSALYMARQFPGACIHAFEPHPIHLGQLAANVAANSLGNRVTVHPYAAGCREEMLLLTDNENQSKLVKKPVGTVLEVKVIDWLASAMEEKIDLLKVDIEGGEYDIVLDQRFEQLRIPYVAIEWHATPDRPEGDREIIARLTSLGYRIYHGMGGEIPNVRYGMLWGVGANRPPHEG